jgi:hypothetical protein
MHRLAGASALTEERSIPAAGADRPKKASEAMMKPNR